MGMYKRLSSHLQQDDNHDDSKKPIPKFGVVSDSIQQVQDSVLGSTMLHNADNFRKTLTAESTTLHGIVTAPNQKIGDKVRRLLFYSLRQGAQRVDFPTAGIESRPINLDELPNVDASGPDGTSVPMRMFDLETLNVTDTWSLDDEDQYCMLSHSWKGNEVDFQLINRIRKLENAEELRAEGKQNDVNAILNTCDADVQKAQDVLMRIGNYSNASEVRQLLQDYIEVSKASGKYDGAKSDRSKADTAKAQAEHTSTSYTNLLALFDRKDKLQCLEDQLEKAGTAREKAEGAFTDAKGQYDTVKAKVSWGDNRARFYGIQKLLSALEYRKSSRKLKNSIELAKKIFAEKSFSKGGKKYIWLDNCCINKSDNNELTESLARMGDWYRNGAFCLVHLDTAKDHQDSLDEWDLWKKECGESTNGPSRQGQSLNEFNDIPGWKPTWSTRGWTLQELVLSKVTYYVNPDWEMLDRPIDLLGPYYNLCPLIKQYIPDEAYPIFMQNLDELEEVLGKERPELQVNEDQIGSDEPWARIIEVLRAFHFSVPKYLDEENARLAIAQSVQIAIRRFQDKPREDGSGTSLDKIFFNDIRDCLGPSVEYADTSDDQRIRLVIDALLFVLSHSTYPDIKQDREVIASFSNLDGLDSWTSGAKRDNFAAHSVMNLASMRRVTKDTDTAYSLMGLLRVQFPAFPAEGLSKALSRLMDEVIITTNDVSIFNWSGKYNASSVKGRSLYASNIRGFQSPAKKGEGMVDANRELVRLFKKDRTTEMEVARDVNSLVANATIYAKGDLKQDPGAVDTLHALVKLIRQETFTRLQTSLRLPVARPHADEHSLYGLLEKVANLVTEYAQKKKEMKGSSLKRERSEEHEPDEAHEEAEEERPHKKRRISRGLGKLRHSSSNLKAEFKAWAKPIHHEKDHTKDDEAAKAQQRLAELEGPLKKELSEAFGRLSGDIKDEPREEQEGSQCKCEHQPENTTSEFPNDQPIICPDPIVVNTSGIKGVFDIQRVVVRMLQPEELRRKVKNAVSPKERIDGWCTISTGFALTMVAFSCERDVLEQQLNVAEVVEKSILRDSNIDIDETKPDPDAPDTPNVQRSGTGLETSEKEVEKKYGNSPEQTKVSRMIDFVTESNLHVVAGEWALARFSGSPGAEWFVCRLELGTGNAFYARRIATDAFSFAESLPEKGVVEYWHSFLGAKKSIMCNILSLHLDKDQAGKYATFLGESIASSFSLGPSSGPADPEHEDTDSDDDNEDKSPETRQKLKEYMSSNAVIKMAKMIGWGTRGLVTGAWGRHLEKHLQERVLKNVPIRLQSAILALDENQTLLPVMFHSGIDVHFF